MKTPLLPAFRPFARLAALPLAAAALAPAAQAAESFTLLTNWYAQAEHGGFYQAQANGLYEKAGLDVTIKMGGPQVNNVQMMVGKQADCVMGSSDLQMLQVRAGGVPVTTVAAFLQKDPQVLIAHEDVKSFEDLKGKTILIGQTAHRAYWPWLKAKYGLKDGQTRPYTFNIQPFMADKNTAQQGYLTSEPFSIQQAGGKPTVLLFSDHGYPAYAATITCLDSTVKARPDVIKAFLAASAEGWKSYLTDPAPANALIRQANPNMTDAQLDYGVKKLNDEQMIKGGDAATQGIGVITEARARQSHAFLVDAGLLDAGKVDIDDAYDFTFMKDIKVLP